jgi:carbon-monoxide dehydrogenase medium subunit
MKPAAFAYHRPESIDEAVSVLAEGGSEAKVLAGGQSLIPLLALRMARPSLLVDIGRLPGLDSVNLTNDTLEIGALATHRAVEMLPGLMQRCPAIVEATSQIGHVAIRNRGTVGGSIAHADPAAEWPALSLILDAEFEAAGPGGIRTIPATEMFVSYMQTALTPDEILTRLCLRIPPPGSGSAFVEVARRHGDFAMGGAGAVLRIGGDRIGDARVAVISASLTPVRSRAAEAILIGAPPSDEVIAEAAQAVDGEIDPLEDVHAPADYKRQLAKVTTARALLMARERAMGARA